MIAKDSFCLRSSGDNVHGKRQQWAAERNGEARPSAMDRGQPGAGYADGKSNMQIPAYRIHRTKNLGYVRLCKRMIYLGKANTPESLQRYRQVVGEWLASGRVPSPRGCDAIWRLSVSELVESYLKWARAYYVSADSKPSPGMGPVELASRPLIALYGSTPASEFGPVALKAVRQAMIDSRVCRNVVNQRVGCVKRIFRWGVGEELVPANVVHALSAVGPLRRGRSAARVTDPVRPVPDEHVEVVLPLLPPTVAAMVQLQRLTGMRSGELCRLRTCDVDTSREVWLYRPSTHKTAYRNHERLVRIGPKSQSILKPFLRAEVPESFVFSPDQAQRERVLGRRGELSPSGLSPRKRAAAGTSRCYNPRSYHRALRYAMRRAVKEGVLTVTHLWHPHQLRHRHATEIRQARGLEAARVLLGHRTLSQTLEYAEADAALASSLAMDLG